MENQGRHAGNLSRYPEITHHFGDRHAPFGEVVGGRIDLGVNYTRFVWGKQVHGVDYVAVEDTLPGNPVMGVDAVITNRPGVWAAVKTADCVPVLLYDPFNSAVAAIHSGRVGTEKGIVPAIVRAMTEHYGSRPEQLIAAIGPAICPTCYEVDEESYLRFVHATGIPGSHRHPEMKAAIRAQLLEIGVTDVEDIGGCTLEDSNLCSYRRRHDDGRQISFIGMR
jgi:YfiH family protein